MAEPNAGWTGSAGELALVVQEIADGITVQDLSGQICYANLAAAQSMGFPSVEALIGTPQAELLARFEVLDASGRPLSADELPVRRAVRGDPSPESLIRFRVRSTGEERWSLVRPKVVRAADGSPRFVVSAFRDVTTLRATEQRLTLLADAGEILTRSADYQETLNELANLVVRELADWCVVDVIEEGSGVQRVAVAHRDPEKLAEAQEVQRRWPSRPGADDATGRVLRTGEPLLIPLITDEQIREAATDPEHAEYLFRLGLRSVVIEPLNARGRVLGVLTLVRSDADRAFNEAELPLLRELAVRAATSVDTARLLHETTEAVRARDDFLAVASHDMRTPLAAILGYLQLALRRLRPADPASDVKLNEYLRAAERMTERLTHLVTELMDVSLLQSGQPLAIDRQPVDLGDLASRMVEVHGRLSAAHTFTCDGDSRVVAYADVGRLERVLDNLLSNAIKFSPNGGEIRVTVTSTGTHGRLSVTDAGLGIPAADLPGIFERFRRGSNVGPVTGTGLGLAGSREVMQQMGGDIEVESVEGEGSTFTVVIPLAEAPAPLP